MPSYLNVFKSLPGRPAQIPTVALEITAWLKGRICCSAYHTSACLSASACMTLA
jgi:hypothetical protein